MPRRKPRTKKQPGPVPAAELIAKIKKRGDGGVSRNQRRRVNREWTPMIRLRRLRRDRPRN